MASLSAAAVFLRDQARQARFAVRDGNPIWARSSPREIARDHDRCGVGVPSPRPLRLVRGLKKELVHNIYNLLVRLNQPCGIEILPNLAEHVAALRIDRAHSKVV